MNTEYILKTHLIGKHFDTTRAVHDLSIAFAEGKITGLVGPNGSGKSTLINMLTGVTSISSGSISVSKREAVKKIQPHEAPIFGITRTFQEVRLFEQMTVLDNILVVITKRGWFKSLFETHKAYHLDIAHKVLERVGMSKFSNKLAVDLSYGQRKLLEIARVLAMKEIGKAHIIFFDEPFAGLFPEMRKVVVSIMKELKQQGVSLILVEHNMDLIRELCDTVIVLDAGELLQEGKPEIVLSDKKVVEAYLGE